MLTARGLQGTSRKMIEENVQNVRNHLDYQEAKHKEIAHNQAQLSKHYTAERVERELKDRFREYFADFDKAFKRVDRNRDGYVTLADLRRILLQLNYFLDEEQFLSLLKRLGLSVVNERLSYFDFLRAIDDGRASKFGKGRDSETRRKEQVVWQSYDNMPTEKALAKLKDKVTVNYDSLNSGFRAFDRAQTGNVSVSDFRRLLDNFCFKLTDKQFRAVLTKCKITAASNNNDKLVNWIVFLHDFSQIKDTRLKEWTDYVGKAAPPQSAQDMSIEQVEERLREVVSGRYSAISNAFAEVDYAKIFVVSKDDFREILNEHVMRLNEDQFNRLWSKLPVNEFSNLEYRDFLKKYKSDSKIESKSDFTEKVSEFPYGLPPQNPHYDPTGEALLYNGALERRPMTSDSVLSRPSSYKFMERRSTPLVNAESAEAKLKALVYRSWQKIQRECRKLDPDKSGAILPDEFVGILDTFGVMLSINEARALMVKYDIGERSGMFAYQDFLRNFILNLKPSEENILKRKKIRVGKIPINTGKENEGFVDIMMSLKQKIPLFWKEMRRTFKLMDTKGAGFVTAVVFRQVLRRFTINLTEEDFFNLLSFYDPKMQGRIPYNDFIRAFL